MPIFDDEQDKNVPEQAVRALTEAHRRAIAAGHAVVMIQGGYLVRREGNQVTVLKPIRGRRKANTRVKTRDA